MYQIDKAVENQSDQYPSIDLELLKRTNDLLDDLTLDELYWLHSGIAARINHMQKMKDLKAASVFVRGHKVTWTHNDQQYIGVVMKVNQRTIVVAETRPPYKNWKISPGVLKKIQ
jgi:hypothetical protein